MFCSAEMLEEHCSKGGPALTHSKHAAVATWCVLPLAGDSLDPPAGCERGQRLHAAAGGWPQERQDSSTHGGSGGHLVRVLVAAGLIIVPGCHQQAPRGTVYVAKHLRGQGLCGFGGWKLRCRPGVSSCAVGLVFVSGCHKPALCQVHTG